MYYPDMGAPSSVVDRYVKTLGDKYNFYIITKTYKDSGSFTPREDVLYITSRRHRRTMQCEKNIREGRRVLLSRLILLAIDAFKAVQTQLCHPNANSWENAAYHRQLEALHTRVPLDAVISVSNTCHTAYAAKAFKTKHSEVRWIQFVTDPFVENYIYYRYKIFPSLWRKLNGRDERSFYDKCDAAFITPEMYDATLAKYPQYAHKCRRMQFTLTDMTGIRREDEGLRPEDGGKIKLIYAGAVYKDIRNPEFMMKTIASLKDLHLDMYTNKGSMRGECDNVLEGNTSDNISISDYVPKDRYNDLICNEYDVLVNIGNTVRLQAPSKMLDLLSTGRPILNFYFVEDSQKQMIDRYPLGLNVRCGEEDAGRRVLEFCKLNKGRRLSFDEVKALYPDNVLEYQAGIMEELIDGKEAER